MNIMKDTTKGISCYFFNSLHFWEGGGGGYSSTRWPRLFKETSFNFEIK